ncbi:MAG: alkylhydroperoxidase [Sphingobium sp.]|nr:MAG: alkylhydroperoxidase [Sphingobium sp.]
METRLNYAKAQPAAFKAMMALETAARAGSIDETLTELIKLRVSQINGCAFCVDMHSQDLIKAGENPQRLFVLSAWTDSPAFTDRERAALAWAEALTNLPTGHLSDAVYDALDPHFTDAQKVDLTLLIVAINGWNRFGVGFRMVHPVRN